MITGQVGLVSSDGHWKGRLVAVVSRSRYCHMVIAISETHCFSQEPGGAIVRPISFYKDIVWSRFPMRPAQRRRAVKWAIQHIGNEYAWLDYLAAGVAMLTQSNTPEWLRAFIADERRLICSQAADLALQAAGIHVFHDYRPAGAVVPASFGRVFVARGWTDKP